MSLTSQIRYCRALDSAATDGSGKTSLAFSSITAKYLTQGGTLTSLTTQDITVLGTYQAPTSAAHIRIKELSSSDPTKGVYEIQFHNTQMVDTGKKLWLFLSATGAAFTPLEVDLIDTAGTIGNVRNDGTDAILLDHLYLSNNNFLPALIIDNAGGPALGIGGTSASTIASIACPDASLSGDIRVKDENGASIATAASIAALNNLSAAQVGALTITELVSIPGASPTLIQAIALGYMALRNKLNVTASAKTIHNNGGTALGAKNLSDDGTTYSEAKLA